MHRIARFVSSPMGAALALGLLAAAGGLALAGHYYLKYAGLIDAKLEAGPFAYTSNLYAAPRPVFPGERLSPAEMVAYLQAAGYSKDPKNAEGWYRAGPNRIEIHPGPDSYFSGDPGAAIEFSDGAVARIVSLDDSAESEQYALEPQLMTNIGGDREKRRLVSFAEIPPVLVDAVVSAEDKHFFRHSGFDSLRLIKAVWIDVREGRKEQGASTITMQLARTLWLSPAKRWTRKAVEMLMTLHLEHKLSKQQIFEYYANQVYLGRTGTYSVHGFGEAARVYFDKDLRRLTVAEAATLGGLIQRPSYFDPFRNPARTVERRNYVLGRMRQNGYIGKQQYDQARTAPLGLVRRTGSSSDAPYFLDLVNSELRRQFPRVGLRDVYTTLDLDLQRTAVSAVHEALAKFDARLRKQRGQDEALPQVAMIALDPHTGEIKALVGGRSYSASQLDRALAIRQPGSVFKPFVYAAAFNSVFGGARQVMTPASIVDDTPTTFRFGGESYTPANFHDENFGPITLRTALEKSANVATIKVARAAGLAKVVAIARAAGLSAPEPTPAVAIGSYDASPLSIAGAYTVFSNGGVFRNPSAIAEIRGTKGQTVYAGPPQGRRVLDPRVAWLVENLMEGVMQEGTGARARSMGFTATAAGKTGTSRDGWFAGFTSKLLCVVWVGYDDGRDLDVEGARSALPVWTEFMKRALELPQYADPERFPAPRGIVSEDIDPQTGYLATASCPLRRTEFFIGGSEPDAPCPVHLVEQALGPPPAGAPPSAP